MKIVGIDPGKTGCACMTDSKSGLVKFKKFVFTKANVIDRPQFERWLADVKPDLVVMEKVMGRGGWGATQSFNFGYVSGQILAIALAWPIVLVTPQAWQAGACRGVPKTATAKERTADAYKQLFPSNPLGLTKRNFSPDMLDSFMISIYGQMAHGNLSHFNFNLEKDDE